MDFEFRKDLYGQANAKFSMGHEVIGRYFSEELIHLHSVNNLLTIIEQIEQAKIYFKEYQAHDYLLNFNPRGVEIRHRSLDSDFDDELPEDSDYYDEESHTECGLEDFKIALVSWKEYIS